MRRGVAAVTIAGRRASQWAAALTLAAARRTGRSAYAGCSAPRRPHRSVTGVLRGYARDGPVS
jgi:hypothetical protein